MPYPSFQIDYLTHTWDDKMFTTFRKSICPKVNVIARLEFELTYYDSVIQRFNHYTTGFFPTKSVLASSKLQNLKFHFKKSKKEKRKNQFPSLFFSILWGPYEAHQQQSLILSPSCSLGLFFLRRCPWCNGYRRRNWTRRHEFKSWTRLIAFHIALISLGKVWIQICTLLLWLNNRAD